MHLGHLETLVLETSGSFSTNCPLPRDNEIGEGGGAYSEIVWDT